MIKHQFFLSLSCIPVDTRRRFNVYTMSIRRQRRQTYFRVVFTCNYEYPEAYLTFSASTPQTGQTNSNNSLAEKDCLSVFEHFVGLVLTGFTLCENSFYCSRFLLYLGFCHSWLSFLWKLLLSQKQPFEDVLQNSCS